MKIKFIKDYAINRGACPLNIGGFDMLETEIVKADTVVDLEKDNGDGAFSDELIKWLIDNGFAEEVKESKWWKPKNGVDYYYVNDAGVIVSREGFLSMSTIDDKRVDIGNAFRSKAAAERYRDYLKAVTTVRQDEGVLTPEQIKELEGKAGDVYCVPYTSEQNEELLRSCTIDFGATWAPVGSILFDTEEHADASRKKHQEEWQTILNYDWSRE